MDFNQELDSMWEKDNRIAQLETELAEARKDIEILASDRDMHVKEKSAWMTLASQAQQPESRWMSVEEAKATLKDGDFIYVVFENASVSEAVYLLEQGHYPHRVFSHYGNERIEHCTHVMRRKAVPLPPAPEVCSDGGKMVQSQAQQPSEEFKAAALQELYNFQEGTGCDVAAELKPHQLSQAQQEPSIEDVQRLVEASEIMLKWCVKNVNQWNFSEYDWLHHATEKVKASLPPAPEGDKP